MASPPQAYSQGRRSTLATLNIDSIPEELAVPKVATRRRSQPIRSKPSSLPPTHTAADSQRHAAKHVTNNQRGNVDSPDSGIADTEFIDTEGASIDDRRESEASLTSSSEEDEEEAGEGDNSDSDSGFSGSIESSSNTGTLERNTTAPLDRW